MKGLSEQTKGSKKYWQVIFFHLLNILELTVRPVFNLTKTWLKHTKTEMSVKNRFMFKSNKKSRTQKELELYDLNLKLWFHKKLLVKILKYLENRKA